MRRNGKSTAVPFPRFFTFMYQLVLFSKRSTTSNSEKEESFTGFIVWPTFPDSSHSNFFSHNQDHIASQPIFLDQSRTQPQEEDMSETLSSFLHQKKTNSITYMENNRGKREKSLYSISSFFLLYFFVLQRE